MATPILNSSALDLEPRELGIEGTDEGNFTFTQKGLDKVYLEISRTRALTLTLISNGQVT